MIPVLAAFQQYLLNWVITHHRISTSFCDWESLDQFFGHNIALPGTLTKLISMSQPRPTSQERSQITDLQV